MHSKKRKMRNIAKFDLITRLKLGLKLSSTRFSGEKLEISRARGALEEVLAIRKTVYRRGITFWLLTKSWITAYPSREDQELTATTFKISIKLF